MVMRKDGVGRWMEDGRETGHCCSVESTKLVEAN